MFRVNVLPAEFGDCLWIEYGASKAPRRVLIDCGTEAVYRQALKPRIQALKPSQRHFELFVVTHVDVDHIGGAVEFLADSASLGVSFGDVWFNGYEHLLKATGQRGAIQGEELTALIRDLKLPWNRSFRNGPVVVPDEGGLPVIMLRGAFALALLSPTPRQLLELIPEWEKTCTRAGLIPGMGKRRERPHARRLARGELSVEALADSRFTPDRARPNGSSIALLARFNGKRVLLGADAFAPVLLSSLSRLKRRKPLRVDAFKLAHHGSRNNTNIDLVRAVTCKHWIVSTNGKLFDHPDREAIARVIKYGTRGQSIHFNYRTEFNEMWSSRTLSRRYGFTSHFPGTDQAGVAVTL